MPQLGPKLPRRGLARGFGTPGLLAPFSRRNTAAVAAVWEGSSRNPRRRWPSASTREEGRMALAGRGGGGGGRVG